MENPFTGNQPARFLSYRGDRADLIGQILKHPISGYYYTIVETVYDPATDTTRVGMRLTIIEDIPGPDPELTPPAGRITPRGPRGRVGRGRRHR